MSAKKVNKKKHKFEFSVDRSKWYTGGLLVKGDKPSEDTMCVLGFLGKKLGADRSALSNCGSPTGLPKEFHKKLHKLGLLGCMNGFPTETEIADEIMEVNDAHAPNKDTEKNLKSLFKKLDIKVNFIGKYASR